jgi:hypothetical protein
MKTWMPAKENDDGRRQRIRTQGLAQCDGIGDSQKPGHGGEYEPRDSRNVTGTASTQDGRWTNIDGKPPLAAGRHEAPQTPGEAAGKDKTRTASKADRGPGDAVG